MDGVATLRPMEEGHRGRWLRDIHADSIAVPVADVMVTVDHDSKVYPGLVQTGAAGKTSPGRPTHVAIAGENLHALRALKYTHRASVDLIYIDPPYNTGNKDWVYNDRWVDSNDSFRHSKWLAFMRRRLRLAYDLLKDTGVIIVAIGDDEQHRLRILMDEVFGESNFISNVVWQGGRKNDSRYVSNGADYMLIYAKDESAMGGIDVRWRERRAGVDEILEAAARAWADATGATPAERAQAAELSVKQWQRMQAADHPARSKGLSDYTKIDETGEVYRLKDISWPGGGGPRYDVLHPSTGQPVKVPGRGWIFSNPERMQQEIDAGQIVFGADHHSYINRKSLLTESDSMGPESVFSRKRTGAGAHLRTVLGDKRFPFPKDHEVLMRWIRLAAPSEAVVLDFFGGSGSTAEAVMRLNAEDGGTRQAILVTNNEVAAAEEKKLRKDGHLPGSADWKAKGVFERVTRPRLTTILTGQREDGSTYDSPVDGEHPQRVEFFDLGYVSPRRARLNLEWKRLAPLLWMRGGALGDIPARADEPYVVTDGFAALWGSDHAKALAAELTDQKVVFIVTDSEAEFVAAAKHFDGFECRHLWNDYLGN